ELRRDARLGGRSGLPAAARARPRARRAPPRPLRSPLLDRHVHAHALRPGVRARRDPGRAAARAGRRPLAPRRDRPGPRRRARARAPDAAGVSAPPAHVATLLALYRRTHYDVALPDGSTATLRVG